MFINTALTSCWRTYRRRRIYLDSRRCRCRLYTQTTANLYVNTDPTTSLSVQRYADIPLYVNMSPYSSAPLSQPIQLGQSNVTDTNALYAQSYISDLTCSSGLVALDRDIAYTRSSYADNSQPLPIAVGQPGLSAFSRVDVTQSRPVAVDSIVQYAACTSVPSVPSVHQYRQLLLTIYGRM